MALFLLDRFDEILQDRLPIDPALAAATRRLPGTGPVPLDEWLVTDEAYQPQMAYRDHLIATRRKAVFACLADADAASATLLQMVVDAVSGWPGYVQDGRVITRADGQGVSIDAEHPLIVAGKLVQEDLCIVEQAAPHRFVGAISCFPAHWTLAEKLGRPLEGVHDPVREYDDHLARRVGRLFAVARPDVVLCRHNCVGNESAQLHAPRTETAPRDKSATMHFTRVERQTVRAIPDTGCAVFGIHTYVVAGAPPPTASAD